MFRPWVFLLGVLVGASHGIFHQVHHDAPTGEHVDSPPLFLTPLIKQEKYSQAKESAKVSLLNITSYSGFLTVDELQDNNLFIWYFPAQDSHPKYAPTIVWLDGGPGLSSMYGLFVGNGPYLIENGTVKLRERHWNQHHSMLYIDNPVGTGFSFSSQFGYRQDQTGIANDLYEALRQLSKLFPEIKRNSLYISGHSYGGKYVPAFADTIFKKGGFKLAGIIIGNGFIDPYNQIWYSHFLNEIGLIDNIDEHEFEETQKDIQTYISYNFEDANKYLAELIINLENPNSPTMFKNATGFTDFYSILGCSQDDLRDLNEVIQAPTMRKYLHVGDSPFSSGDIVKYFLRKELTESMGPTLHYLMLNGVKVLLYNGQLDVVCAYSIMELMLSKMDIPAGGGDTPRKLWYVNDNLAGYWKDYFNLATVLVRKAGHVAIQDQPDWVLNIVEHFTGHAPAVFVTP